MSASRFEVPGSVVLRDVSRARPGESLEARLHRLAQKAVIEGCCVLRLYGSGAFVVTSGADPLTAYAVDRDAQVCGCPGFARHGLCKHLALVLAELGELPDPPTPAAPAIVPAAIPTELANAVSMKVPTIVPIAMEIACTFCGGTGVNAITDRAGRWREVVCPACRGNARGRIAVDPDDLARFDALDAGTLRGAPCAECRGEGYRKVRTGDRLGDWEAVPCAACAGAGLVPVRLGDGAHIAADAA